MDITLAWHASLCYYEEPIYCCSIFKYTTWPFWLSEAKSAASPLMPRFNSGRLCLFRGVLLYSGAGFSQSFRVFLRLISIPKFPRTHVSLIPELRDSLDGHHVIICSARGSIPHLAFDRSQDKQISVLNVFGNAMKCS
jgi:hypothetical protein